MSTRHALIALIAGTLLSSAQAQTLTPEFVTAGYAVVDLGSAPGVPANYGGLTIRPEEPNTLYLGGAANGAGAALYAIDLVRDGDGHITGFSGTATAFVNTPNIDGGVLFAPNGTLLYTRYSMNMLGQVYGAGLTSSIALGPLGVAGSVGSVALVPQGFPAEGSLIVASYNSSNLYRLPYTIDVEGQYLPGTQNATVSVSGTASGPEGITYIPPGSAGFDVPSMAISSYSSGKVVVFDVDADGLPLPSSARDLVTGMSGAEGAMIDPVTGDFLFSTFGGGNRVILIKGFADPNDCAGVPFGQSIFDECGVCRLPDDPDFNSTCTDCAGVVNGEAFLDNCGDCVGGTTGEVACVQDCNGEWGGSAFLDNCGDCVGGTTGEVACVQDCNDEWGGEAFLDNCGDCVGGTTGEVACVQDCNGEWGGSAFLDNCGDCVGGTTGEVACVQDCNGEWGGTAFLDNCGDCVGGTTGEVACVQDCNGEWGGEAYIDNCNNCVGGGTGMEPCLGQEGTAMTCSDGIDNDGDGLIDCDDPQCQQLYNNLGCVTCFWDGLSFADVVLEYVNTCPNNTATASGNALGMPDYAGSSNEHVSLGRGHLKLGFTNNTLINSGDDEDDLFVFEVGPLVEPSFIELRPANAATEAILIAEGIQDLDGDGFYEFGGIGGSTAGVDIDSFFAQPMPFNSIQFDAIKIVDGPGTCSTATPGADIDAVCALSSLTCAVGQPCDDGDPLTENDVYTVNCDCVGTPIYDCPELEANNGDDCLADGTPGIVMECECLVQDCNGDFGGTAYLDDCGDCVGGTTGEVACVQDCNGEWGGSAFIDSCGDCVGGTTGEEPCVNDCAGVPGGSAFIDNCGDCVGGTTGEVACVQDCNGEWGGSAFIDNCGDCVGGTTGEVACVQDCNGEWGGSAFIDNCGDCVGGTTGEEPCVNDCAGVPGGSAFIDNCGDCVGGTTGEVACVQDCNGEWGGSAFIDNCGDCVGGTTGEEPCVNDCAGVPGGSAFIDNCGDCVGGTTGEEPCVNDCAGVPGGSAFIDNCGDCVGGTTGEVACVQDCNDEWGGSALPGTPCDDGNENTGNDTWTANCDCVGTPVGDCTNDLVIEFATDANGAEIAWSIEPLAGGDALCGGSGLPDNAQGVTATCCLPDGCYRLVVTDAGGDGIAGGGYVLRTVDGDRIIDNAGNFSTGGTSSVADGFCVPLGDDRPIHTSCDRFWWIGGNYLVATENPAVSAQFGVSNATSGYEFWFFDPNGGLSFRKFRDHATSDGYAPNNAVRACHIKLNNWAAAQHLQDNVLYNVRIRGVIDGVELPFGPACRVTLDPVAAACTPTGLNDITGHPNFSCGVSRTWGGPNSMANRVYARSVGGANKYEFEFSNANEGYLAVLQSNTVIRHLNWSSQPALNVGSTYTVRVRASKDGGATWCSWGWACEVTIAPGVAPGGENLALDGMGVVVWPNPNNGRQLWMAIDGLTDDVRTIAVDVHDLGGKRVMARGIALPTGQAGAQHGAMRVDLGGLASGTYVVAITAGDQRHVERLVIVD